LVLNNIFRKRKASSELARLLKEQFKLVPNNVTLYEQALRHSSAKNGNKWNNNERLEFLGDSVLDTVVADILFESHPKATEGELTKMRSAIVSRRRLDLFGKKIGLMELIEKDQKQDLSNSAVCGNALEALIGAIFIDKGFDRTKKAVEFFLSEHLTADEFDQNIKDPKSRLLEWGQKYDREVVFKTTESEEHPKVFEALILIDGTASGAGSGSSKKRAEQSAAAKALEELNDD